MPTLRILYDVDGWAFHNRALALRKYAPPDFDVSAAPFRWHSRVGEALGDEPVDLVFLMTATRTTLVRSALDARHWTSKLVAGWSTGWPGRLPELHEAHAVADWVVFNNRICWERTGRLPRTSVISNGVDADVFRVVLPIEARRPRVLWVGSQYHRSCKGYDDFVLPLWKELGGAGIDCEALLCDPAGPGNRTPAQMAEWYNGGTVLVCASAREGTPNPALEAAACGCTVVSTRVGDMPELIRHGFNGFLVERDLEALAAAVREACEDYPRLAREMREDIRGWDWRRRSALYFELFRSVLRCAPPRAATPIVDARETT